VERLAARHAPREAVAELLERYRREHQREAAAMLARQLFCRCVAGPGRRQATAQRRDHFDDAISLAHRQDAPATAGSSGGCRLPK
jgi:hypothetical protein